MSLVRKSMWHGMHVKHHQKIYPRTQSGYGGGNKIVYRRAGGEYNNDDNGGDDGIMIVLGLVLIVGSQFTQMKLDKKKKSQYEDFLKIRVF